MTNEIPVSLFSLFLIIQFGLLIYSIAIKRTSERIDYMITAGLSGILGYLNSNMILNSNVNMLQSDGTTYSYIPIQSLPLHYFLLGVSIITFLILFWFIIDFFRMKMEENNVLSALDGDL